MNAMNKLLKFGAESKNKIKMAKRLKEDHLDEECTFEPHFFTNPKSRLNAQARRKSQASLILELELVLYSLFEFNNTFRKDNEVARHLYKNR